MLEIECKVRVPALEPVRERLLISHGTPLGTIREKDAYFNAPHRDFATTDEALRIRTVDGRCVLTYKGAEEEGLPLQGKGRDKCGDRSGGRV